MKLFVFGLGYSALATVAALRRLQPEVRIAGTTRDAGKAERLRATGIAAHLFDGAAPSDAVASELADTTHLLLSIAPGTAAIRRCLCSGSSSPPRPASAGSAIIPPSASMATPVAAGSTSRRR